MRKAFTLLELTVAVALLLLLAALLMPVFSRVREQGRKSVCASNLKQIGLAFQQYAQDYADQFPQSDESNDELKAAQPYLKNSQILICPSDIGTGNDELGPSYKEGNGSSYFFNGGVTETMADGSSFCFLPRHSNPPTGLKGVSLSQIKSPNRVVLAAEKSASSPFSWHDGPVDNSAHQNAPSNLVFVDGHVKYTKIYLDDSGNPPFTYDDSICYDPPANYEYQWSEKP